jgi:SnoaL-like domain
VTTDDPEAEVATLLNRYFVALDQDELDDKWATGQFTRDARIEFPMSSHAGIEGLAAYHRESLGAFARTQHLNSPAVVRVGETTTLQANLISTHVHLPTDDASDSDGPPLFVTGTSVSGEARLTSGGWRLSRLSFRLVWATGTPPSARC